MARLIQLSFILCLHHTVSFSQRRTDREVDMLWQGCAEEGSEPVWPSGKALGW